VLLSGGSKGGLFGWPPAWPPSFLLNFTIKFVWLSYTANNFQPAKF